MASGYGTKPYESLEPNNIPNHYEKLRIGDGQLNEKDNTKPSDHENNYGGSIKYESVRYKTKTGSLYYYDEYAKGENPAEPGINNLHYEDMNNRQSNYSDYTEPYLGKTQQWRRDHSTESSRRNKDDTASYVYPSRSDYYNALIPGNIPSEYKNFPVVNTVSATVTQTNGNSYVLEKTAKQTESVLVMDPNNTGTGVYDDIPADYDYHKQRSGPFHSHVSLRSTSSVEPILPRDPNVSNKKSKCHGDRKKKLILIVIILAIVCVVGIVVAAAISKTGAKTGTPTENIFDSSTVSSITPAIFTDSTTSSLTPSNPLGTPVSETTTRTLIGQTTVIPDPIVNSSMVMIDHPREAVAVIGDTVTLCCYATGEPAPLFYDWLKDNQLLPQHTHTADGTSVFTLTNSQLSDSGQYACRASNNQDYILSDFARLDVRASNSFCQSTPELWIEKLPTNCRHDNSDTINRGHCPSQPCSGGGHSSCLDNTQMYCCGPVQLNSITVNCSGDMIDVSIVTECGCVQCHQPYYDITGIAKSPSQLFSYGHVYLKDIFNGNQPNDRIDGYGYFHLTVYNNTRRLVLKTDNYYDQVQFYTSSSHILHLPPLFTGPLYTTAELRFLSRTTYQYNSNALISHLATFADGSDFVELYIPAGHYYTQDGNIYDGMVHLSVNGIKGDDFVNMRAAPGDFVYIGVDGKEHYLITHGLLAVQMLDGTGLLYYNSTITLTVNSTMLAADSSALLWRLGNSGFWHVENNLRPMGQKKRRKRLTFPMYEVEISGIDEGFAWFTIASPVTEMTCITKVRIFDGDTLDSGTQLSGAQVEILIADGNGMTGAVYTTRAYSDRGDINGYCIDHPCSSLLSGQIMATYDDTTLIPITTPNDGNKVNFTTQILSGTGPTYFSNDTDKCSKANISLHSYIAFKRNTCLKKINAVEYQNSFSPSQSSCELKYYRSWHTPSEYSTKKFRSCHIKVITQNVPAGTVFRAISYVGNLSQLGSEYATPGTNLMYGLRDDCTIEADNTGIVCLEIKTGGQQNCNDNVQNAVTDVMSTVSVFPLTANLTVTNIAGSLNLFTQYFHTIRQDAQFRFQIKDNNFGNYYGIYCSVDASPEKVKWMSNRLCLGGESRHSSFSGAHSKNHAVKFG